VALVFQIALGLLSGVFFFALLQKAYFAGVTRKAKDWFGRLDVVVALALSGLFAWQALHLFGRTSLPFQEETIGASLLAQVLFAGAILGYLLFRKVPLREFFGVNARPVWKSVALGGGLMLAAFPFISMLAFSLSSGPAEEQEAVKFFRETSSVQARCLLAIMAVLVAPIAEELVFRGLLYQVFAGYFGKISAMFFTSVLFAAIHGNIPALLPLTLLAFALTAGLEWSGSLLVSIAMHATFNATSLALTLYEGAQ